MNRLGLIAFLFVVLSLSLASCEREFSTRPGLSDLLFASDSLDFGTVIEGEITPTSYIALYNCGTADLLIDNIALLGGESSYFGVNINGHNATSVSDVRLAEGDSLLIFAYVKNPVASGGKAVSQLSDILQVSSGSNTWQAVLAATVVNVVRVSGLLAGDNYWTQDTIAYLITDSLVVDAGASLTIGQGVTVYMATDANLQVYGTLTCSGNDLSRILIRHLRQDSFYDDIPGQWGELHLYEGATATLNGTTIACNTEGVLVDSLATLTADGLWIRDCSHGGIALTSGSLTLSNSLLTNVGGSAIDLERSSALLTHVTIANYYSWATRSTPSVWVADSLSSLVVRNSIIAGSLSNEVNFLDSASFANILLSNTLLRATKTKVEQDTLRFVDCLTASDAKFYDRTAADYHITSASSAYALADSTLAESYPIDIEGTPRIGTSDVHAGAFQSTKE